MSNASRKARGMRTQLVVAQWFQKRGFPHASSTGAGRPGVDIENMVGCAPEVKARREFSPMAWLRQASGYAGLSFVVFRCDGQGEANVGEWGVLIRLDEFTGLLRDAGYGDDPRVSVDTNTDA